MLPITEKVEINIKRALGIWVIGVLFSFISVFLGAL
jgi:hypothetical protein